MSTQQYLRKLSIALGTPSGDALEFSDFRVKFEIRRGDWQTPNSADVTIYNLSDATKNRVTKEFTQLAVQAGYPGNFGIIFTGEVKQYRNGRESQTDNYLKITAADGDRAYNFATLALTLAAGTKPKDEIQAMLASMASFGVTQGYVPELSTNGRVRARTFYGMTRDALRDFAEDNGLNWSIQDGKLTLIPHTSFIPGEIPVISVQTGLIGIPEQTQNGIEIRTLLNPSLKIGQLIKLDATVSLYRYPLDTNPTTQTNNIALSQSSKLNSAGLYYVMSADHSGDTREQSWYSDLTCLAVDARVPLDAAGRGSIAPGEAIVRQF